MGRRQTRRRKTEKNGVSSRREGLDAPPPGNVESAAVSRAPRGRLGVALRVRLSTLILFAGAFAIRVAVASQLSSTPLFRTPELDYREYWTWAERIAAGNFAWPIPPAHGPGYPYFLAALLALLGGSAAAARLVQAALGAALCVVVSRIGERAFGRAAGLAAGGLLAVCG